MILLSSAPSLEEIEKSIARFYAGENKTLIPTDTNIWKIVSTTTGKTLQGVRVTRKHNRYRFESDD